MKTINRPELNRELDSKIFRNFYYLKEELVAFCKQNNMPASGGKLEITNRIAYFLDTRKIIPAATKVRAENEIDTISDDTKIESHFVCSEKHRTFFADKIGRSFTFNVAFQKWLKSNSGRTYSQAIAAYYKIIEDKKSSKTIIDKQFEYNTYIRDFFMKNKGKTLGDAIRCWKYKKNRQGHNRYEESDLVALS